MPRSMNAHAVLHELYARLVADSHTIRQPGSDYAAGRLDAYRELLAWIDRRLESEVRRAS